MRRGDGQQIPSHTTYAYSSLVLADLRPPQHPTRAALQADYVLAQIARNEQPMERALDMAIGRVWAYAAATADRPSSQPLCGRTASSHSVRLRPSRQKLLPHVPPSGSTPALLRRLLAAGTLGRHDHVCGMVRAQEQDVRIGLVRLLAADGVGRAQDGHASQDLRDQRPHSVTGLDSMDLSP
jgi:hypothetical protein